MTDHELLLRLGGEVCSLRFLVTELIRLSMSRNPELAPLVMNVFGDVESVLETFIVQVGEPNISAYLSGLAEPLEEMRASLFDEGGKPKGLV